MVAEIGGYVGLLLGVSLVNIGKMNSFILDCCLDKTSENEKSSHKNNQIHVTNAKHDNYI